MKIAEEAPPKKEGKPFRAMLAGGAGIGLGIGASELVARRMKWFNPSTATTPQMADKRLRMARIILPILSGASVMLADRYRQRMNEEYRKTPGYENGKK